MRVTVQNGANHGLTRAEAEKVVSFLPEALSRSVKSLTLYQGSEPGIKISFHPKEKVVGVYWPSPSYPFPTKAEALEELLIALSIIAENGKLPESISKSLRAHHLVTQGALLAQCREVVIDNAA